jgi:hypothetical protein
MSTFYRVVTAAGLVSLGLASGIRSFADEIDFNADIRPILSNTCYACHGPDDEQRKGGLRFDLPASAFAELDSGSIPIVPGKPGESALFARISSEDEDERMPPADFGKALTDTDIEKIRQWIEQGGKFAQHWSYVELSRPKLPDLEGVHAAWAQTPVDRFALNRMMSHGLAPSTEADRYSLVRRLYLDLMGLPPTLEEVDAFVQNEDPKAYENLVEELLKRPEFGEHWARKWLDLARYADSSGYADDPPRTIWAYRDWVIKAINDDMPFDQFTVEQLAGDLLPNPTSSQLVATAFHRNTMTNNEGGTQDEEFRNVAVVDRVNTTMAVWMGTTIACAQCHNHKYDPISQEEYFRFFAILNSTQDADRRDDSPRLEIYTDAQKDEKEKLELRVIELAKIFATPTEELQNAQSEWEKELRRPAAWNSRSAQSVTRSSKAKAQVGDDGVVFVESTAPKDVYTVELRVGEGATTDKPETIAALRLETLPSEKLPGKGSGWGGGNFVVTGFKAQLVPDGTTAPSARFVRITNNGKAQILSLAEVQVISAGNNVALAGKATQHSTAFAGPPEYAIDGKTDGVHANKSVTHTDTVDDPWWEVDLTGEKPIDSIVIWNRTDNKLHTRLNNFTVALLDEAREPIWQKVYKDSPNPSATYAPTNIRDIRFRSAFADHSQPKFNPSDVLTGKVGNENGWAVGGQITEPHQLIVVPSDRIAITGPTTLRIHIEQNSPHPDHILGQFRLSTTTDRVAIDRSRLPAPQLAIIDSDASDRSEADTTLVSQYYRDNVAELLKDERKELQQAEKSLSTMKPATSVPIVREMAQPRETRLQHRGNYLDKGDAVTVGVPAAFHAVPDVEKLDRLALAKWIVDSKNPLTARVIANRYWETFFGQGIVLTSEEFGSQGELPTHPQLLDWLASDFVESGWNTKALIRAIVTSSTYRQSSKADPVSLAADSQNRWLARGPRVRLSAEMVRDQALRAAGLLSAKMYGPPVKPPQPNLGLTAAFGSSTDWQTSMGEDRYRRGIYTLWRRSNPYPSMATFDAPNREVCTVRRNSTNTPLQSLVTLNDPVYIEAAQALARVALSHNGELTDQLCLAFRRCVARHPRTEELAALDELFHDARKQLATQEADAMKLATEPLGALPEGMDPLDAAAMTVVGNVLLNLDEMFLKR